MEIYRADGEIIYLLSPVAIKAGSAIFFPLITTATVCSLVYVFHLLIVVVVFV